MELEQMSIEEKLAMLGETDKAYILGFIDGALSRSKKTAQKPIGNLKLTKAASAKDKKESK